MSTPKKILYIDDDEDDLAIFAQALLAVSKDAVLYPFSSGEAALNVLKSGGVSPEVIFLDFNMPGLNGLEVLKRLRDEVSLHAVPVVLFSTARTDSSAREAIRLGAIDFLKKPSTYGALCELLRQFLASTACLKC